MIDDFLSHFMRWLLMSYCCPAALSDFFELFFELLVLVESIETFFEGFSVTVLKECKER